MGDCHEEADARAYRVDTNRTFRISAGPREGLCHQEWNVRGSALPIEPEQLDARQLLDQGKLQPLHRENRHQGPVLNEAELP